MYPEFAYSRAMQLILAAISFVTAYIFIYSIANLILQLYGEQATAKQKRVFAFWVGVVLDSGWVYTVYFIGGMVSFSDTVYFLVVTANPLFACLYYVIGIRVLKLSQVRSIKLMGYVYVYFISTKSLSRVINSVWFAQQSGRYNYMLDAFGRITFCVVFLVIFWVMRYIIKRDNRVIELRDNLFINLYKELWIHFAKAVAIYLFMVFVPLLVLDKIAANIFVLVVCTLGLTLTIVSDLFKAAKNTVENNLAYIGFLSKAISITYMGDAIDLDRKANQNLSLISILMDKCECAKKMEVKLKIELNSDLNEFYIRNVDVCKIVDTMLDNALKAAAVSEQKWVSFMVAPKSKKRKLFIVSNSIAPSFASAANCQHRGKSFSVVWKTIRNYGNCIFHVTYYKQEMLAYLETKQRESYSFFPRILNTESQ